MTLLWLALPPFQIYGMFKAAIAAQGPKLVEKVKGVIVYVITGGPNKKRWTFYTDLKNGEGKVGEGRVKKVRHLCVVRSEKQIELPEARKQQPSGLLTLDIRSAPLLLMRWMHLAPALACWSLPTGGFDSDHEGQRLLGHCPGQDEAADGVHAR